MMARPWYLRKATGWCVVLLALSGSAVGIWIPARAVRLESIEQEKVESLSTAEFSQLVQSLSEDDGHFRSDNFTSNETSYLHVVGKLREMHISGGAYLGVGPEQNFTYIAKVRPRIAFIVDIRRQAMLQHLLYKAVFHMSQSRAQFLSGLLSRPLAGEQTQGEGQPLEHLLDYFVIAPAPAEAFAQNLARVRKIIQEEFKIPLSAKDQERLEFVLSSFHKEGLEIAFRIGGSNGNGGRRFPNLRELILQPDLNGRPGNFLASEEDYRFVRNLHLGNRIIPVVGDFAGPKALSSVSEYLRKHGYTVRAFYTSNVEQFLFQNGNFQTFVENVRKLPIDADSVFIRAVARGQMHPALVPGHRTATVLQKISVFLRDYDLGLYSDYGGLVSTHYIAGQ